MLVITCNTLQFHLHPSAWSFLGNLNLFIDMFGSSQPSQVWHGNHVWERGKVKGRTSATISHYLWTESAFWPLQSWHWPMWLHQTFHLSGWGAYISSGMTLPPLISKQVPCSAHSQTTGVILSPWWPWPTCVHSTRDGWHWQSTFPSFQWACMWCHTLPPPLA